MCMYWDTSEKWGLLYTNPESKRQKALKWQILSEIHAGVRYFKGQIFENPSNKKVSHLFKNVVLQIQISNACRGIYI